MSSGATGASRSEHDSGTTSDSSTRAAESAVGVAEADVTVMAPTAKEIRAWGSRVCRSARMGDPIGVAEVLNEAFVHRGLVDDVVAVATWRNLYGKMPLFVAAEAGHAHVGDAADPSDDAVRLLLAPMQAEHVRDGYPDGKSPLDAAVSCGATSVMGLMMRKLALDPVSAAEAVQSPTDGDEKADELAFRSADSGHEDGLVVTAVKNGRTALHWAGENGALGASTAKWLLQLLERNDRCGDCVVADSRGQTAFHRAAARGNDKLIGDISVFVERACGTEVGGLFSVLRAKTTFGGMIPLHLAAVHGKATTCALLLQLDADKGTAALTSGDGCSILHFAARSRDRDTLVEVMAVLLEAGTLARALACRDSAGMTPLHTAVVLNNCGAVALLVDGIRTAGVDQVDGVDAIVDDDRQFTALLLAAAQGNTESVELIVQAGADMRHRSPTGQLPHALADKAGNPELAEFLRMLSDGDLHIRREEATHKAEFLRRTLPTSVLGPGGDRTDPATIPIPYIMPVELPPEETHALSASERMRIRRRPKPAS